MKSLHSTISGGIKKPPLSGGINKPPHSKHSKWIYAMRKYCQQNQENQENQKKSRKSRRSTISKTTKYSTRPFFLSNRVYSEYKFGFKH